MTGNLGERAGEVFRYGGLGFPVALPPGASVALELPPVIALEGGERWDFRPVLVVAAEELAPATSVDTWVDSGLISQSDTLVGAEVLDRQSAEIAGGQAVRTLVHHAHDQHAVALEQWWLIVAARGWVLSASCAAPDYDRVADDFAQLVAGFVPVAGER